MAVIVTYMAIVQALNLGTKPSNLLERCTNGGCNTCGVFCRLTLSQFNPLLEEVAFIREGGSLRTAIAPTGGKLPAESGQVRLGWCAPKLVRLSWCQTPLLLPH
jgi:hypothetical protein